MAAEAAPAALVVATRAAVVGCGPGHVFAPQRTARRWPWSGEGGGGARVEKHGRAPDEAGAEYFAVPQLGVEVVQPNKVSVGLAMVVSDWMEAQVTGQGIPEVQAARDPGGTGGRTLRQVIGQENNGKFHLAHHRTICGRINAAGSSSGSNFGAN